MVRLAGELGASVLPTCMRELANQEERRWRRAHRVLCELGRGPLRNRVGELVSSLLRAEAIDDDTKIRAISIIAELELPVPETALLRDPNRARRVSVAELLSCLKTRADMARAADFIVMNLPQDDILGFMEDIVMSAPALAAELLEEFLVRDDIDSEVRQELRVIRASLAHLTVAPSAHRPSVRIMIGQHRDGRRLAIGWARMQGTNTTNTTNTTSVPYRASCVLLDSRDVLVDADYREGLDSRAIESELLTPLRKEGFELRRVTLGLSQRMVGEAARRRCVLGKRQPRAYFLGRDLFGLRDQHLPPARRLDRKNDLAALLSRALELSADGEFALARPLYEQYLQEAPDDADARAGFGVCLLQLGDVALAEREFSRALELEPDNPIHLWNLATAAHQLGHGALCQLTLTRYLALGDLEDATAEREQLARALLKTHQQSSD
jgi:tetratricopeptide (TPR) repeat protein